MALLKPGDDAPDFATVDDQDKPIKLSDLRGKRVVIYFYPRDDTPGCTKQACEFRDSYPELEGKNAVVLGVSPQDVKSHEKFKTKYALPFPLLVDKDHAIAEAYGVWQEKMNYGKKYMGITRSHFVIDENGKVMAVKYNVKPVDSAKLSLLALA